MTLRKFSQKFMYATIALGLLFSTACKKDSNGNGPVIDPVAKKLVKIEEDANNYISLEYNANGTVKKLTTVENEEGQQSSTSLQVSYNDNKTVKEVTTDEGAVIKYTYANNQLSKTEIHSENQIVGVTEFTYQGGKIASTTAFVLSEDEEGEPINQPYMKTEYVYAGNDLKEVKISLFNAFEDKFELASVRRYEQYDTKSNPLAQLSFLNMGFFGNLSAKNVLLEKAFDGEGNLEETIQNVYTYDAQGYPTTCKTTTTPAGGTAEIENVKYHYN